MQPKNCFAIYRKVFDWFQNIFCKYIWNCSIVTNMMFIWSENERWNSSYKKCVFEVFPKIFLWMSKFCDLSIRSCLKCWLQQLWHILSRTNYIPSQYSMKHIWKSKKCRFWKFVFKNDHKYIFNVSFNLVNPRG